MNQVYTVRRFIDDLGFDETADGDPVQYENCEWVICERNDATDVAMILRTDSFHKKNFWPTIKIGDQFVQILRPLEEDEEEDEEILADSTPQLMTDPRPGDPNFAAHYSLLMDDKCPKVSNKLGIENED